ncbi:hypothetical protein [Pseudomonas sp. Marseille-Q8238]
MDSLLSDWRDFCEAKAVFDKSHFFGLLKSCSSSEDLRKIFKYFPFSEELVSRAGSVIFSGKMTDSLYLLPKFMADKNEVIKLGGEWLREQERVSFALGDFEISEIFRNAQVIFVTRSELDFSLQQDIPHYWFFDEVGDAVRESKISDAKQVYALFESFYGLAADYYLAWYIGRPLFSFEIDLEPYFKFWCAGGKCALTEKGFLVSN